MPSHPYTCLHRPFRTASSSYPLWHPRIFDIQTVFGQPCGSKVLQIVDLTSCFPKSHGKSCQKKLYTDCGLSSLQNVLESPYISNLELQNPPYWWLSRLCLKSNAKCLQHDKTRYLRLGMLQYGPDYLPSFLHRTERTKFANFKNGYDLVTMDPQYFVPSFGPNVSTWVIFTLPILHSLSSSDTRLMTTEFLTMAMSQNKNDPIHCHVQHLPQQFVSWIMRCREVFVLPTFWGKIFQCDRQKPHDKFESK